MGGFFGGGGKPSIQPYKGVVEVVGTNTFTVPAGEVYAILTTGDYVSITYGGNSASTRWSGQDAKFQQSIRHHPPLFLLPPGASVGPGNASHCLRLARVEAPADAVDLIFCPTSQPYVRPPAGELWLVTACGVYEGASNDYPGFQVTDGVNTAGPSSNSRYNLPGIALAYIDNSFYIRYTNNQLNHWVSVIKVKPGNPDLSGLGLLDPAKILGWTSYFAALGGGQVYTHTPNAGEMWVCQGIASQSEGVRYRDVGDTTWAYVSESMPWVYTDALPLKIKNLYTITYYFGYLSIRLK